MFITSILILENLLFSSVLVVALVYVVAGSVFLRVRRQASGKDMVPNVEFWSSIPGLIKARKIV